MQVAYDRRAEVYSMAVAARAAGVPYQTFTSAVYRGLIPGPSVIVAGGKRKYYTVKEFEGVVKYFKGVDSE